jgi:hypothetical protein
VSHTPQKNGVAQRKNMTLVECARNMLKGKNISNVFWAEAINIVVYLKNRSPTKIRDLKTPFEVLYGYKPEVGHLRIFGSKVFAHIREKNLMQNLLSVYLLAIVIIIRHTSCLILVHIS